MAKIDEGIVAEIQVWERRQKAAEDDLLRIRRLKARANNREDFEQVEELAIEESEAQDRIEHAIRVLVRLRSTPAGETAIKQLNLLPF